MMGVKIIFGFGGPEKTKGYEGSSDDMMHDYAASRRRNQSTEHYEDTAHDRIADHAGERRMRAKEAKKELTEHETHYKPGVSAFNNPPKYAHSFHPEGSSKVGHLRLSGTKGAHRLGARKR